MENNYPQESTTISFLPDNGLQSGKIDTFLNLFESKLQIQQKFEPQTYLEFSFTSGLQLTITCIYYAVLGLDRDQVLEPTLCLGSKLD